jgi:hypothetical protein
VPQISQQGKLDAGCNKYVSSEVSYLAMLVFDPLSLRLPLITPTTTSSSNIFVITSLQSPLPYASPDAIVNCLPSQTQRDNDRDRCCQTPEEHVAMLDGWELLKVHAKITRKESQWQEENGNEAQLLQCFVLREGHATEDKRNHA